MPAVALAALVLPVKRHGSPTHKQCSWGKSRTFTPENGQCCSATDAGKLGQIEVEEAYLGISGKTVRSARQ